jgi:hypothetical protein
MRSPRPSNEPLSVVHTKPPLRESKLNEELVGLLGHQLNQRQHRRVRRPAPPAALAHPGFVEPMPLSNLGR